MSYVLPKETKTQKVSSLPDDLRSIAEELIKDKFKVREKKPQPAWGEFPAHGHPAQGSQEVGYGPLRGFRGGGTDDIRVEVSPWDRSRVANIHICEPSHNAIIAALERFDRERILGRRSLIMSPPFFEHLLDRDSEHRYIYMMDHRAREDGQNVVAQMFGCDIVIHHGIMDCVLESVF